MFRVVTAGLVRPIWWLDEGGANAIDCDAKEATVTTSKTATNLRVDIMMTIIFNDFGIDLVGRNENYDNNGS